MALLQEKLELTEVPVAPEYQTMRPKKALGLMRFEVNKYAAKRLASITLLNAKILGFITMFSLVIRPDYAYNMPILSSDVILMGDRRIILLEVIDTTDVDDTNLRHHYVELQRIKAQASSVVPLESSDWYLKLLAGCSLKLRDTGTNDGRLLDLYCDYVTGYLEMARHATQTDESGAARLQQNAENFLETLLERGGPAVNVFKWLLGVKRQHEYVRNVMFGIDC